MKDIIFPSSIGQRYYHSHYLFLICAAEAYGLNVKFQRVERKERGFVIKYRGEDILIDYGDHGAIADDLNKFSFSFRYHYLKERHNKYDNIFPLTPISFYNWDKYKAFEAKIKYGNGRYIQSKQKPGAAAFERRTLIQYKLKYRYGGMFDNVIEPQESFWLTVKNCLVSVCVPGARIDILDRGQFQYMAFGACTISPELNITLPWDKEIIPGEHYIKCENDFSDLLDKVDWCEENRLECIEIGKRAKKLFQETSTPERMFSWIDNILSKEKERET